MIDIFDNIFDSLSDTALESDTFVDLDSGSTIFDIDTFACTPTLNSEFDYSPISQVSFGQGVTDFSVDTFNTATDSLLDVVHSASDFIEAHMPSPIKNSFHRWESGFHNAVDALKYSYESIDDFFARFYTEEDKMQTLEDVKMPTMELISERPLTLEENMKIEAETQKYERMARMIKIENEGYKLMQASYDDRLVYQVTEFFDLPSIPIFEMALDEFNKNTTNITL